MQRWAEIKESQCTDFYPIGIGGLGYHIGIGLSERDWDIREGLGYQRGIGDIREGLGISERDWDIREGLGYQRGIGISERDWGNWDIREGLGYQRGIWISERDGGIGIGVEDLVVFF